MAKKSTKAPAKTGTETEIKTPVSAAERRERRPLDALRREVDRIFEDFDKGFSRFPFGRSAFEGEPFWRRELSWGAKPAVDIVEKDKAYEVTAELPGMDEKDIEVEVAEGGLTIKGEKQEEKEREEKGYHLQERHYGSFERYFRVPEGVDADKIEASFKNGVLTVMLPKTPEAQKPEKKIEVKPG